MNIAVYHFGTIEIDGRTYTSDVIITPERVLDSWWRQEGHRLAVADLTDVVARDDRLEMRAPHAARATRDRAVTTISSVTSEKSSKNWPTA